MREVIRMTHPVTGGESLVTKKSFDTVWSDLGWEQVEDGYTEDDLVEYASVEATPEEEH